MLSIVSDYQSRNAESETKTNKINVNEKKTVYSSKDKKRIHNRTETIWIS